MNLIEAQVDRIVGPTHHFGGLGVGNVASQRSEGKVSNPQAAAIQGLDKMRMVASLGAPQFVLPPHVRPDFRFLRSIGFAGDDEDVLKQSAQKSPHLLSAAMSCSAMWTANAATVSPGADNDTGMLTLSVANLVSSVHRAIEPDQTLAELRRCFPGARVVPPIPGGTALRDEGAANHMRLGSHANERAVHVFVYGDCDPAPQSFFPRQSLACCQAIARIHRLPEENTFYLKQHPAAIDAGAFHNDVVAASHHDLLIHHELAFIDAEETLQQIARRYHQLHHCDLTRVTVADSQLSIDRAIATYLFNSQIVSAAQTESPVIICPSQVNDDHAARSVLDAWIDRGIFNACHFAELRQSMSGGGGPACLRLRVPMANAELNTRRRFRWSAALDSALRASVLQHYPDRVTLADLSDIGFVRDAQRACEVIHSLLRVAE